MARSDLDAEIMRRCLRFAAELAAHVRRDALRAVEQALDAPAARRGTKPKLASFVSLPEAEPRKAGPAPNSFQHYEQMALERALDLSAGNKLAAARLLHMSQSRFYRRLTVLGIPLHWSPPSSRAASSEQHLLSLDEAERMALQHALDAAGGHRLRAAELLGVGKSTLHRKLGKHGMGRLEMAHR